MAKGNDNIFVRKLRGSVGDQFVIRRTRSGKTIVANMPSFDENREFSDAQQAQQSAFQRASVYAKKAQKQPIYVERAKGTDASAYNKAMADWFGKPQVLNINARGWTGEPGQTIQIEARDDTEVIRVEVVIHNNGTILERGEAVPSEDDGLLWTYVTTSQVNGGAGVLLDANAYDLPGNCGASSLSLN